MKNLAEWQSLAARFEHASDDWPNLAHFLAWWPDRVEGDPGTFDGPVIELLTAFPDSHPRIEMIELQFTNSDRPPGLETGPIATIIPGATSSIPVARFVAGKHHASFFRRQLLLDHLNRPWADTEDAVKRFAVLAAEASRLLCEDTSIDRGDASDSLMAHPVEGMRLNHWLLTVHHWLKPQPYEIIPNKQCWIAQLHDINLASAQAIHRFTPFLDLEITGNTLTRHGRKVTIEGAKLHMVALLHRAGPDGESRHELSMRIFDCKVAPAFDAVKQGANAVLDVIGLQIVKVRRGVWRLAERNLSHN